MSFLIIGSRSKTQLALTATSSLHSALVGGVISSSVESYSHHSAGHAGRGLWLLWHSCSYIETWLWLFEMLLVMTGIRTLTEFSPGNSAMSKGYRTLTSAFYSHGIGMTSCWFLLSAQWEIWSVKSSTSGWEWVAHLLNSHIYVLHELWCRRNTLVGGMLTRPRSFEPFDVLMKVMLQAGWL